MLRITAGDAFRWRDALLALALFAAVVRALVPQGFMLAEHNGSVGIVICTADGAKTVSGATRESGGANDAMAGMNAPCGFAGLGAVAPPPDAPIVSLAQAIALVVVVVDQSRPGIAQAGYRPQAPRAPPSFHV